MAKSLGGWLRWEVKSPSGQNIFSSFFGSVGRKKLPETGEYTTTDNVGEQRYYRFKRMP